MQQMYSSKEAHMAECGLVIWVWQGEHILYEAEVLTTIIHKWVGVGEAIEGLDIEFCVG